MSEEHSPTPWRVDASRTSDRGFGDPYVVIVDARGDDVTTAFPDGGDCAHCDGYPDMDEANARRAVACVNELRDIPTEVLESGAVGSLVLAAFQKMKPVPGDPWED